MYPRKRMMIYRLWYDSATLPNRMRCRICSVPIKKSKVLGKARMYDAYAARWDGRVCGGGAWCVVLLGGASKPKLSK